MNSLLIKIFLIVLFANAFTAAYAQLELNGPLEGIGGEVTGPYCAEIPNGETPFYVSWDITNGTKHSGSADCAYVIWDDGATSGTIKFKSGSHGDSETLTVNIRPKDPVPGVPTTEGASRCDNGPLTLTVSGGGDDVDGYKWYDAHTGGNFLHEGNTYTTSGTATAQTTTYWVAAYNDSGEGGRAQVTAAIYKSMSAGSIISPVNDAICANSDPGTIGIDGHPSGKPPINHQWQYSYDEEEWFPAGVTSETYDLDPLAETTYFRRIDSDDCGRSDVTNSIVIEVFQVAGPSLSSDHYNACEGESLTIEIISAGNSDTFEWVVDGEVSEGMSISLTNLEIGDYDGTVTGFNTNTGCQTETVGFDIKVFEDCDYNQNYIKTISVKVPGVSSKEDIQGFNVNSQNQVKTYYNGLGLPSQEVIRQFSPINNGDMVTPITYDSYLRRSREYLPYIAEKGDGEYVDNSINDLINFYQTADDVEHDPNPYAQTIFEESPLNRVSQQGASGVAWQPSRGHAVSFKYGVNSSTEKVIRWSISSDLPEKLESFRSDELEKTETQDENGYSVIEYKNRIGQVLLKRTQVDEDGNLWADTYYIYDDFNNLRFVFPPAASSRLETYYFGQSNEDKIGFLKKWAYQYKYDGRRRLIIKSLPGAGEVHLVYDKRDRLVLTQDEEQRKNGEWLFTKYTDMNRPALTGIFVDADPTHDRDWHQEQVNNSSNFQIDYSKKAEEGSNSKTGNSIKLSAYDGTTEEFYAKEFVELQPGFEFDAYEYPHSFEAGVGGEPEQLNDGSWIDDLYDETYPPLSESEVLTFTYYDNYEFTDEVFELPAGVFSEGTHELPTSYDFVSGQVTGIQTRILETEYEFKERVNFYDDEYRLVQTVDNNHVGGRDVVTNQYDFSGKLVKTHRYHENPDADITDLAVTRKYGYDQSDRLLRVTHQIDGNDEVVLQRNEYNALGEVVEKALHSEDNGMSYLQQIDYRYNIRGWLTHINDPDLSDGESDYFGMELGYHEDIGLGLSTDQMQYNGNISAINWSDETSTMAYAYDYDPLNRINRARSHGTVANAFNLDEIDYDLNGNITNLARRDKSGAVIDQLTYDYGDGINRGNQLLGVVDNTSNPKGFNDGNSGIDYSYDYNGNIISDLNKDIISISYNHMNLPSVITKSGGERIEYTYDAEGNKLTQKVYDDGNSLVKRTDYVGEFIYETDASGNTVLQLIQHEEGRIVPGIVPGSPDWEYQYHLTDHLGNTRVTFTSKPKTIGFNLFYEPNDYVNVNGESIVNDTDLLTSIDAENIILDNVFDHTDPHPLDNYQYAYVLNGNESSRAGSVLQFHVGAGDKVNASTNVKLFNITTNDVVDPSAIGSILTGIITSGGGSYGENVTNAIETGYSSAGGLIGTDGFDYNDGQPKVFLNLLFIPDDGLSIITEAHFKYVQVTNANNVWEELTLPEFKVEESGVVVVYVSNEDGKQLEAYFDDTKVEIKEHPIIQKDDYYPFGLTFNSYQRVTAKKNRFTYSGKELQNDYNLDWLDFGARFYSPELSRFTSIDPLADQYSGLSPYAYAGNSPILSKDPDGRRIFIVGTKEYRQQILAILQNLAASSKTGRQIVYDAIMSDDIVVIAEGKTSNGLGNKSPSKDGNKKALLTFNIGESQNNLDAANGLGDEELKNTPEVSMAHELKHFNDYSNEIVFGYVQDQDNPYDEDGTPNYFSESEVFAVDAENKVRSELGLPLRTHYGGINVFNKELESKKSYRLRSKRNPTNYSSFSKGNTTLSRSTKNLFESQLEAWWKHNFRIRTGKNTRYGFPSNKITLTPETGSVQITKFNND